MSALCLLQRGVHSAEAHFVIAVARDDCTLSFHDSRHHGNINTVITDAQVTSMDCLPRGDIVLTHRGGLVYHHLVRHNDVSGTCLALNLAPPATPPAAAAVVVEGPEEDKAREVVVAAEEQIVAVKRDLHRGTQRSAARSPVLNGRAWLCSGATQRAAPLPLEEGKGARARRRG